MISPQERKHAQDIVEFIAPILGQLINKAVLEALRQHHKDTAWEVRSEPLETTVPVDFKVKEFMGGGVKPSNEEYLALIGEFDATKWADVFMRTPTLKDRETMVGWFANAIMAGYDHRSKEYRTMHKRMGDCLDVQADNGNWNANEYMLGLFNGMEHMMAIVEDRDPQFRSLPEPVETTVQTVARDASERNVWAQAYNAAFNMTYRIDGNIESMAANAAHMADAAVKAFRERYK